MNSDNPRKLHMDDYLWRLYFKPALDRSKTWKDCLSSFGLGIRNGLCFSICAVEIIRRKPEKAEEMSDLGQRIAKSLSLATEDFCEWVKQELVSKVEEEPQEEPGSSPNGEPAVPPDTNYAPWKVCEEAFKSDMQVMLDYSVSAIEAVRLKPESAEEVVSKVTELVERTSKLTQDFCAMVQRDFVSKIEKQNAAKERKAWRRASGYSPRPNVDGGEGWGYSRNGD